jgi:hypothetical protein
MRVGRIVRQVVESCASVIHRTRLACVMVVVEALIRAQRLSIAAIGREIRGSVPKHAIKRVDRLLGNGHLRLERSCLFAALAAHLLRNAGRPVIILDWTQGVGKLHALVAAVPIGGRAVPIYEEVYPEKKLGNCRLQERFLQRLQRVLPVGTKPMVVTDAGFYGSFFRAVLQLGWDFVGRVRGTAKATARNGSTQSVPELYRLATTRPEDLGWFDLYTWRKAIAVRLVLVRSKRRPGRRKPARSRDEAEARRKGRDPWLLATSVADSSASVIVSTYSKRMQIEEAFRDAKNHRFGWSLRHVSTRSAQRLETLLLLVCIALFVVTLIGLAAELSGRHRLYQANTLRRRVLSFFVLGNAIITRGDTVGASWRRHALLHLRDASLV